ncbi:hypothetical protein [Cellulophaga baltica]|uniref:hypothetical protein n=1 Tax=Cellulophaga baltica TaxID=76594 RepID=UPI0015F58EF4|nr:hypothetical protein [Cellulophaga baltica]MBA6314628.1 hypothetical protein [Cellulophaga baltica]
MKKLVPLLLIVLSIPFVLFSQTDASQIQQTLTQNFSLVDQFSQLAPMAINPYITIFLTSLCSKIGFHNDFVATNPFFNNWFVLILFGALFLFTALVGTVFKTNKATAPIGLADNYLSNHAALIINGFVMLAPTFLSDNPAHDEIVYQASFFSISLKTIIVLAVSMYFLVIVMTFRFFIDILIFLSPIPLIDTILEVSKIVLSIVFVLISIISPITSVIFSGIMFIVALFFYRKSIRLVTRIKYLLVYPILNVFRKKDTILTNGTTLSILVYINKETKQFKKGKVARLEKRDNQIFLLQKRFLLAHKEEEITLENCYLTQTHLDTNLTNEIGDTSLILNRSYHKFIDEIAKELQVDIRKKATLSLNLNTGFLAKLKNMFTKSDIAELTSIPD